LNSKKLYEKVSADFYDYIIVDEFHHAAADGYQKMLSYFNPKILLGLTATPERMDGKDILNRRFMGVISGGIKSFLNSSPKEQQKFLTAITPPKKQCIIPFTRTQQKD
jgi:hypothetical protein